MKKKKLVANIFTVIVMRSERLYTKSENVISRFSWHYIQERTRRILKKKLLQKLISTPSYGFQSSKLQEANFEKKTFTVFIS